MGFAALMMSVFVTVLFFDTLEIESIHFYTNHENAAAHDKTQARLPEPHSMQRDFLWRRMWNQRTSCESAGEPVHPINRLASCRFQCQNKRKKKKVVQPLLRPPPKKETHIRRHHDRVRHSPNPTRIKRALIENGDALYLPHELQPLQARRLLIVGRDLTRFAAGTKEAGWRRAFGAAREGGG